MPIGFRSYEVAQRKRRPLLMGGQLPRASVCVLYPRQCFTYEGEVVTVKSCQDDQSLPDYLRFFC